MSQQTFPFDRDFQIGILALISARYDFMLTSIELLQPDYFEDKVLAWFYQTQRDYFLTFHEAPVLEPVIANEMKKAARAGRIKPSEIGDYAAVFREMKQPVNAQAYVIAEVIRFCKRQEARKFMVEIAPQMDAADTTMWEGWLDKFQQISSFGSAYLDIGTDYFATIKERSRKRREGETIRTLPVGIPELDEKLNGGLKVGQLGIWLAATGGGKSIALPLCGRRALVQGCKVVHYTMELSEDEIAERYDAAWSHTNTHELTSRWKHVEDHILNYGEKLRYNGRLIIKQYPTNTATVNTLVSHLKQLASNQWHPDLIIVDYGDLLKPTTNYENEYSDLGATFKDLRGLAGTFQAPVWTATQVNRGGMNAEIIDIQHIGDSLKKAQISDVIIALCQTPEEKAQDLLRLYGAKNRNGPSNFIVPIKSDYPTMRLYSMEATQKFQAGLQQHGGQALAQPAPPPTMPTKRSARKPKV